MTKDEQSRSGNDVIGMTDAQRSKEDARQAEHNRRVRKEMLTEARRIFWESCVVTLMTGKPISHEFVAGAALVSDKLTAEWDARFGQ